MAFPNFHFQNKDTSTKYATSLGALLQFKSMIDGSLLQFKAFLTTFSQDFTSTWNTENVFGRVDPIPTFSNTTRKISLAWDIPAYNVEDAINNLTKCQSLVQMIYPNYQESAAINSSTDTTTTSYIKANSLSKPPLIKVKFANLIANSFNAEQGSSVENDGLLGWAEGVNWQPNLEAGMFVVQSSNGGGESTFYPKMISISMTFNVLHQGVVTRNGSPESTSFPFGASGNPTGQPNPNVSGVDKGGNNE